MRSRVARLTLLVLFVVVLGVTAYLFWSSESLARGEAAAAREFQTHAHAVERAVLDLRGAQQGYVAAGQGADFWATKVAAALEGLRGSLAALRVEASVPQAQTQIDSAGSLLRDLAQMDRRARDYAQGGQKLLASDLIFSDGVEMTDAVLAALEEARSAEVMGREASADVIERRQAFALIAAAAAASLVVLLLMPTPETAAPAAIAVPVRSVVVPDDMRRHPAPDVGAEPEGWSPPRPIASRQETAHVTAEERPAGEPPVVDGVPVKPPAVPAGPTTDFSGVASLCGELARVIDTRALPALLERAAGLLDASGIIIWIADPDGRELNPVFAQGYAPQLVARLGTIPRDAQNATAAAFRTSLLQVVANENGFDGAVAAPLVTPGGCVGVMAAELKNGGERQDGTTLAAAAIVAAQLATLVGPPSSRAQNRVEAAGA